MSKKILRWFGAMALLALTAASPAVSGEYQGFADRYAVQVGDLNSDGRQDLHLRFKPPVLPVMLDDIAIPIAPRIPVKDFVLQQDSSGGFSLVPNLTAAQQASISAWGEIAAQLIYGDFNVDGMIDVLIRGVSGFVPGAKDAIVFAPQAHGASPAHVRSWDTGLEWFVRDVVGWVEDSEHYYDPGLVHACQPRLVWIPVHEGDEFGNVWYRWEPVQVVVCGTYLDTTNYSVPALEFLNEFIYSLRFGDLWPQVDEAPQVSQILKSVLGIPIMRDTLENGGADWGVESSLKPAIMDPDVPETRDSSFARLRLESLFKAIRKLVIDTMCDPPGTQHDYEMENKVCPAGASGCTQSDVYFGEMLYHPVTGYWDRKKPFFNGETGYARMGCTWWVAGACDPLSMLGWKGVGIFDGGPIQVWRYDSEYRYQNQTLPGHLFHSGTVNRWSQPDPSGGVKIRTVGGGTGACPTVNQLGGLYIFWTLDRFIECHIAGGCGKAH
jgi:hypothetical protein